MKAHSMLIHSLKKQTELIWNLRGLGGLISDQKADSRRKRAESQTLSLRLIRLIRRLRGLDLAC